MGRDLSMTFIETIPGDRATGDVRAMYEQTQASLGYVPNYAKVFSHRPRTMAAWAGLLQNICSNLDDCRYELITLSATRALRSSYCTLAHGAVLRQRFYPPERLG
jgi:alkylhydroperoxidase family enzyme